MKVFFIGFAILGIFGFGNSVFAMDFEPEILFSAWEDGGAVQGVIGSNGGSLESGSGKLIIYFVPKVIDILIKITAPIVFVMFIISGMRYIQAGDDEEQYKKARQFFQYGIIGLICIVLSFSLMKAVYFIFA